VNETNASKFKKRAVALAVASCLSLTPWLAQAAGLGKITVFSGLGQPLRAELGITASADELTGMTARLAPPDTFLQAGIDYASVLQDFRVAVEKRAGGQAVVTITSSKPINEPFINLLIELNWPAGRLNREYTFLLDPQDLPKPTAQTVVSARVVDTAQGSSVGQPDSGTIMPRHSAPPKVAPSAEAPRAAATSDQTRVVKAGDTLRKIAGETQYEGVSLEQMLVGLFRQNPEAFSGKNMNRLKSGAILGLPDKETLAAIPEDEAKRVFKTQAADWNAYRQKLAAAAAASPTTEADGSQASAGQITARVEEKLPPAEQTKDQVKVARTGEAAAKAAADAEADRIARDKALQEAQERVAMLEKNLAASEKLLRLQSQQLADLQKQAAQKETAKPTEPPKVDAPPKEAEAPVVEAPKEPEAPIAEPPKETEAPAAEEAKPAEEAPLPVEPPKPAPPPPPPPEPEPESIFDDPWPLAGGAGLVALLAGFFFYRRRRTEHSALETTTAPHTSSLGPNSVFRMSGGQSVDTGDLPPPSGDFSQTGPGTIDTDEVDPVSEADVYMAYGRDTQAEEILLEALQKDPQRLAIPAKLLEIYAGRRSIKQFETLASEFYAQTGGAGPDWEKVAILGVGLDPHNPLYSGAAANAPAANVKAATPAAPAVAPAKPAPIAAKPAEAAAITKNERHDTVALGQQLAAEPPPAAEPEEAPANEPVDLGNLDFNLDAPRTAETKPATAAPVADAQALPSAPAAKADDSEVVLDFDISGGLSQDVVTASTSDFPSTDDEMMDAVTTAPIAVPQPGSSDGGGHDFSVDGTLLMAQPTKTDLESHMKAAATTFVGSERKKKEEAPEEEAPPAPLIDTLTISPAKMSTDTVVNPLPSDPEVATQINTLSDNLGDATVIAPLSFDAGQGLGEHQMAKTQFNVESDADGVEFDVSLTDSVFLGELTTQSDFDISSINLDLGTQPAVKSPAPAGATPAPDAQWEEVNTKLDLAKAYEEMGDLEGARELLQEVVGEGSPDLAEQAKTILARIGG